MECAESGGGSSSSGNDGLAWYIYLIIGLVVIIIIIGAVVGYRSFCNKEEKDERLLNHDYETM